MMKVAEIEEAEKDKMRNKCKKIIDHGTYIYICAYILCVFVLVLLCPMWLIMFDCSTNFHFHDKLRQSTAKSDSTFSIYTPAGITCFINRQLIYNFPEQIFTEAGVISIEHADFDGRLLICIFRVFMCRCMYH